MNAVAYDYAVDLADHFGKGTHVKAQQIDVERHSVK